jgi:hypothetical protein
MTSLTTGATPARHGVLGYRLHVGGGDILNVLRWRTPTGDSRQTLSPIELAPLPPFGELHPPVITRSEFLGGGFSEAHLRGARLLGWRLTSTLVRHVVNAVGQGEPFVYAYYDGPDKIAHEFGLGDFFDAEIAATDALVAQLLGSLPSGVGLVVTSDHGQVDVGSNMVHLHPDVAAATAFHSGEGRFRWLHARPGAVGLLAEAARAHHRGHAWVRTLDEAVAQGWFGGALRPSSERLLGDVVLAASAPVAFVDPADPAEVTLVSRHGSLTPSEMLVPLLAAVA